MPASIGRNPYQNIHSNDNYDGVARGTNKSFHQPKNSTSMQKLGTI